MANIAGMEKRTTERKKKRSYHGRVIRDMRELLNLTQEGLGSQVNMSQKQISRLESREQIDEQILATIALALKIPVEILKNYNPEDRIKSLIQNNDNINITNCHNINAEEQTQRFEYDNDPNLLNMFERMMKCKDDKIEELLKIIAEKDRIIYQKEFEMQLLQNKSLSI